MNLSLKHWIIFAGCIHLGVLVAGSLVPGKLRWKEELQKLPLLNRQVHWTHGAYVFFTIFFIGLTSVLFANDLASGTVLARYLCGAFSLFWLGRLALGARYFDVGAFLTTAFLRWGYRLLNLAFILLCVIYGYAAFCGVS